MYGLLIASIIAASLNSVVLHKIKLEKNGAVYMYNFLGAAVWCVILFAANKASFHIDADVLLWGCLYGITQTMLVFFKTVGMNSGPVSITTLIGNLSLLVSVGVSFIIWSEPIRLPDIAGIVILVVGILLTVLKTVEKKFTKRWLLAVIPFFLCASAVGLIFKAFSKSTVGRVGDMMFVAAVVMLVTYALLCVFTGSLRRIGKSEGKTFVLAAVISGALACLYNRLNVYLTGKLEGAVFFPGFNGGVIMLSAILGVVLCKEKLSARQIFGIITGTIGICIIGIF